MRLSVVLAGSLTLTSLWNARDARACGGCFLPPSENPTVVTGHQMAVSVSSTRTILWDRIEYQGNPTEFAWVLPVTVGTTLEVSTDAWFETLEPTTAVSVTGPQLNCQSGGGFFFPACGGSSGSAALSESGDGAGRNGVQVIHRGTVGPYETVTLRSTVPSALTTWLGEHNFNIDPTIQPVIDAYVAEQFDFIALRLQPGQNVSAMKPVRAVYPGMGFAFPLRMVAAGTGDRVGITLFVLGEGRWSVKQATNVTVNAKDLSWNFDNSSSNYVSLRDQALAQNNGDSWLTSYAKKDTLFAADVDPTGFGGAVFYSNETGASSTTIAEAYIRRGLANEEATNSRCLDTYEAIATSTRMVVDPCNPAGSCRTVDAATEIDYRDLKCGALDDVAAALVGMRPASVWLTRLEANLPRSALSKDLSLEASAQQEKLENLLEAEKAENAPCELAQASTGKDSFTEQLAGVLTGFMPLVLGMTLLRRSSRKKASRR